MGNFVGNNVSSGNIIYAADHNELVNRIAAVVNGGLDDTNIGSLNGTKVNGGTLPASAFDTSAAAGWKPLSDTFTYAGNNGNKEFLIGTSADFTGVVQPGDKLKVPRGTTPPTQCMSFTAASSQYATKSSPAGITFTGAFTCEAWIYLNSYQNAQEIVVRLDRAYTSGGWEFGLNANGQILLQYGAASSFTNFQSYQSVPLKRWVHVAGVVSSTSSKTGAIYINGIQVPSSSPATAASSLTQASVDLRVGAGSATPSGTYFDGYISEARVWSTSQTQANVKANMAISLTGSEANLVALFQGNGNFNDLTTNANNLTATNGAIATQAANPYNATEYGYVTAITSSQITVFCGTDCNVPNQTLGAVMYSHDRSPYGFPSARTKWVVETLMNTRLNNSGGAVGTWFNLGWQLSIPSGEWNSGYDAYCIATAASGTASLSPAVTLSTTNNGATDPRFSMNAGVISAAITDMEGMLSKVRPLSLSAQTIYYLNISSLGGTTNALYQGNNTNLSAIYKIQAELAYV